MSKYINLINKISDADKQIINLYLNKYGCKEKYRIPLNSWLENWSHANQKLYKLLEDSFIYTFDIEYEKPESALQLEIIEALRKYYEENSLSHDYQLFCENYIYKAKWINADERLFFKTLLNPKNFIKGTTPISIKIKKPGAKKTLQIPEGTKILKAMGRVFNYFKDDYEFNTSLFENFKNKYAIIMTQKQIKTKGCISIHPMDYITMSDNNSNWTSCMNWKDEGCYRIGTVEMMNSNNVLCCYMINPNASFVFDTDTINSETGEIIGTWNNKAWRQLFYITKDILMGGKAYPYASDSITTIFLDKIKELASINLNWNYKFGPELYQDMIHVGSEHAMRNQRIWAKAKKKNPFKHNIIWDTSGMYNDMLNDNNTKYWCYRNKVNHTKVISLSGKTKCLCCGNQSINYNFDYAEDYNDRFNNTDNVICEECLYTMFKCDYCNNTNTRTEFATIGLTEMCSTCQKNIKVCPCCGEVFYMDNDFEGCKEYNIYYNPLIYQAKNLEEIKENKDILWSRMFYYYSKEEKPDYELFYTEGDNPRLFCPIENIYLCPACLENEVIIKKLKKQSIQITVQKRLPGGFWNRKIASTIIYVINPEIGKKYRYPELKSATVEEYKKQLGLEAST